MDFIPFQKEYKKIRLGKLNPEVRIIASFLFALPAAFISDVLSILCTLIIIFLIGFLGGAITKNLLKRWGELIPIMLVFVVFLPFFGGTTELWAFNFLYWRIVIYSDRIWFAIQLFLTMNTMFFSFIMFFSSLTFTEFSHLRIIPSLFRSTLILTFRYIPLFFDQNRKISEAQLLRGKKRIKGFLARLKNFGYMLGTTIVKSLEQSVRTYESLKMRGFGGVIPISEHKFGIKDVIFLIICIIVIFFIIVFIPAFSIM